ncbi:acyl-CoA dehydrogenase family protein, partial [Flavobacterium sp.]|uniref:acyl-CoA dehydrogenase family protein n=1 Tax=Flavobacterium sp. TaxID=239 RepID=UPI00333F18D1
MNSLYFTEEHELFRKSLQDFLQKEVVPHIEKWEKTGTIERFIWKKFGEMGFFGINYPEAYGGLNLDLFYTVVFLEELQKIKSSGFAAAMWAHAYLAMTHLNAEGSEAIKQNYLAPSILGEKIGALCVTEPFGGSDVAGMRTTAVKQGDKFIINGSKTFITNGVYADYYIVAAKTNPELGNKGISIFLVDTNLKGISAT